MPLLGAHQSIAGGHHLALTRAVEVGCETVQLFTKNTNQWRAKEIAAEDAVLFRRMLRRTRLRFPMGHDSYLINLASPDDALYRKSVEAFIEEYQRAELLGLRYLVTHPGASLDSGEEAGLTRIARALDEVHTRCAAFRCRILLENTAGQGSNLGHRFEHLGAILARVREPNRLGICFDTCHAHAAGYALSPEAEYRATMSALDRAVGLRRVRAFHLNDSAKPLGSRVDRHAHIGLGALGLEPFRALLNDPRFRDRPMVLETPKEEVAGEDMDRVNLRTLRELCAGRPPGRIRAHG